MRPTHFKAAIFLLVLVAPTRPMVDQSGGGRFGKIMAPPPMPKEEAPPLTAVSDSPAEETSLEEELDEDDDHAASERKPARSWDARVRDISAKLLERFTSDLGSTTSSVAKAFGRASSALQGLQLPATGFITTLVAVIVGSSPIARTVGDTLVSLLADLTRGVTGMFSGRGGYSQEDEAFDKDMPVFYQSRYKRDLVDETVIQEFMSFMSEMAGYALDIIEEKLV
ncbi:uncharacterized protein [Palaemon carinicauda]|uniref:uncharacterized protein isoform X1 n=1 Tax=Palaemon carinicauda TaxID=392227 RepID=UPI0035B635EA